MLGMVSSCVIVTLSLIRAFFRYSTSKNVVTLKSGLEVTQGHWKLHHSIDCGFLLVFNRNFVRKTHGIWDTRLQKCRILENRVRGPSRSLEISPFDRARTTSYWRSIVTMALSRDVSEIFNVEKCRDFEIGVRGHSRYHWKWYHSIDCWWFPITVL